LKTIITSSILYLLILSSCSFDLTFWNKHKDYEIPPATQIKFNQNLDTKIDGISLIISNTYFQLPNNNEFRKVISWQALVINNKNNSLILEDYRLDQTMSKIRKGLYLIGYYTGGKLTTSKGFYLLLNDHLVFSNFGKYQSKKYFNNNIIFSSYTALKPDVTTVFTQDSFEEVVIINNNNEVVTEKFITNYYLAKINTYLSIIKNVDFEMGQSTEKLNSLIFLANYAIRINFPF